MHGAHPSCFYKLSFHLVLVTKYRNKCLNSDMLDWLESQIRRLLEDNACALIEFNGESDHLHALIELNPSIQPSKIINSIKTVTSRLSKRKFGDHLKKYYWGTNALWSRSYCLISVGGASIEVLEKYIESQQRPE